MNAPPGLRSLRTSERMGSKFARSYTISAPMMMSNRPGIPAVRQSMRRNETRESFPASRFDARVEPRELERVLFVIRHQDGGPRLCGGDPRQAETAAQLEEILPGERRMARRWPASTGEEAHRSAQYGRRPSRSNCAGVIASRSRLVSRTAEE